MPNRIAISGYYGFGNAGDEAVLDGILATFHQLGIDVEVTVLSGDPSRTRMEHPGIESVHRYSLPGLIRAVRRSDLVISGGGSLLQDATSARSLYYYLFVLRLARLLRRKTMVYAQGIGPLFRPSSRMAVAKALNAVNAITVRDEDSRVLLESIGVRVPVQVVADPSFLMPPDLEAADRVLAEHGLANSDFIAVSMRPWNGLQWVAEAGEALRRAGCELRTQLAVVPMQESEDLAICSALDAGVVLRGVGGPRVVKGVIARSRLVVGMRLHSLIFAASEGVPFVPIAYDPKVSSFATMVGQGLEPQSGSSKGESGPSPQFAEVSSLTAQRLAEAVVSAWDRRAELAQILAQKIPSLRKLALESGLVAIKQLEVETSLP